MVNAIFSGTRCELFGSSIRKMRLSGSVSGHITKPNKEAVM